MLVAVLLCVCVAAGRGSSPASPASTPSPSPAPADLPPPLLCPDNSSYCVFDVAPHDDEYFYKINGSSLRVSYRGGQYLQYQCEGEWGAAGERGERGALWAHWPAPPPAAPRPARLMLRGCPLPARLGPALAPLRPAVLELTLRRGDLPAPGLWEGVRLRELRLSSPRGPLPPALADLRALSALTALSVWSALPSPAPLRLPPALSSLRLRGAGLLPPCLPPHLTSLIVTDPSLSSLPSLVNLTQLRELTVDAPLTTLPVFEVHQLALSRVKNLSLSSCASLESLRVRSPRAAPPPAWLRGCSSLRALHVECGPPSPHPAPLAAALSPLPATLRELTLSRCGLQELPLQLLSRSPALERLVLSHNHLRSLPPLGALPVLVSLEVSDNLLSAASLCAALRPVTSLRALRADHNPLGDLCPPHSALLATPETSCLSALSLEEVSLSGTGARRVCADWRRDMRSLARLQLRHNNITRLQGDDLVWSRRVGGAAASVDLSGNNITELSVTAQQYRRSSSQPQLATVLLKLDSVLECGCGSAWLYLSLMKNRLPVSFSQALKCRHPPRALLDIPLEELECEIKDGCRDGCTCAARVKASGESENVTRCGEQGASYDGKEIKKENMMSLWSWSPLLGAVMLLSMAGVAGLCGGRGAARGVLRAAKRALRRRGAGAGGGEGAEGEEGPGEVDVLVVYGYWSSWAADRVVWRLEGEWGLRGEVCLRDWRGGEEEEQCVARGVGRARAVLCVLRGGGGGGGGREARRVGLALRLAPPGRLVLVLLPGAAPPSPPHCRALLHWGAPHFWRDLRRALPPAPPTPPAPPRPPPAPDPLPLADVNKLLQHFPAIKAV